MKCLKKSFGDRKDGKLLKNLDAMHFVMPIIFPNRADNEAYISETIDITNINKYLENKNKGNDGYKYNLFQIIVTSVLKTIMLRPDLNRFIANCNLYQRKFISASFVVKKEFTDNSEEALAFIRANENDTIDTVHNEIYRQVSSVRSADNSTDKTTDVMNFFNKLPRFISKSVIKFICFLDKHGKVPQSFIETDPYYASVLLSNLGSIKLKSGYHHLSNWGTMSIFVVIGEKKIRPFFKDDGTYEMKDSIEIGLTVDERIADGYYYSKSIRLFKKLLENPELLEKSLNEEVEY